jgi:hypothetical protein
VSKKLARLPSVNHRRMHVGVLCGLDTTSERVNEKLFKVSSEMSKWRVSNITSHICKIIGDEQSGAPLIAGGVMTLSRHSQ